MAQNTLPTNKTLPANGADTYIGVSISTLKRWREQGIGPRYLKIGEGRNSKVLYPIVELDKFLSSKLQATA